jgi:uncharacterized protein YdhG (YjbR/CyaY superfamily)
MPTKSTVKKGATRTAVKASKVFTAEERDAMMDRATEVKAGRGGTADLESDVLEKIAAMLPPDRAMAERIHAVIKRSAPALEPKLWYGMPAYAKNGKVLCFFQPAQKFRTRYATFGFNDPAHLDDGSMWPVAYALKALTAADEAKIAALAKKAAS